MKRTCRKAAGPALALALAGLVIGACGSDGGETTTVQPPPVSEATADHLAKLSNRIASDLDAGLTCDAAYAADELKDAVDEADLSPRLRPGVEAVATRLVNEVNCPPPPPPPEPEEDEEKKKEEKKTEEQKRQEEENGKKGNGGPGHGGVPPAEAKLKGEEG